MVQRTVDLHLTEQALCLTVLHIQASEFFQLAAVESRGKHRWLNTHAVHINGFPVRVPPSLLVGDLRFPDVKAKGVDLFNVRCDLTERIALHHELFRHQLPQFVVNRINSIAQGNHINGVGDEPTGLKVHEFADYVDASHLDVVKPAALRQRGMELPCLRIHKVRRKFVRITPEKRVGQRHIAPIEIEQMQPHQQHGQCANQFVHRPRRERATEHIAVWQGELKVFCDKARRELLSAGIIRALRDYSNRLHAGNVQVPQLLQRAVLVIRHRLTDLLDSQGHAINRDQTDGVP